MKRFSEFASLHEALRARYNVNFDLPAKTPIRYFNADKLEDRKNALNAYLKELCRRNDLTSSPAARSFFSADGSTPAPAAGGGAASSPGAAGGGGGYNGANP